MRPIGATRPIQVKVRVLAATNLNLAACVEEGSFRKDLYYRRKVMTIRGPLLCEGRSDILPLERHFIAKYAVHTGRLSESVHQRLAEHDWPGNIRELRNTIERALLLCDGPAIDLAQLPEEIRQHTKK